ncbi:ABC transporter substrate-binding protein [Pseudothauera rhizosphaerae]|uniref:Amino acid ABC transporter substrate-binding protein n=1 Tax=Pseudothauera rhizosphaerae TaxID=2565932 RepID=A0A4S4AW86_9RHOO|nr:ABC transporter substrate-binding protein [Pseudothauera rhizosphaerae]THF64294.1 amino acid ABC transporter substrate-binding protein [Pseudothauera rhizosphaerae]
MSSPVPLRLLRLALGALLIALTPAAPAAPGGEPIRIGVSGPFTGGSNPMGVSMREGIRIAVDEINAGGGVLGRPLVLLERDDEARNERGAQVVQELIKEGVVAGLGIVNTGVALASQRFYQQARIPVITSVATGSLITKQFLPPQHPENFVFRISASDTLQAAMIVEEAVARRGLTRVAIFHDATNYGQLGREDLERALTEHGIQPVAVERFQLRQADMLTPLRRARAAGAQAILTYGIGPELAQIANGMARMGWHAPLIGSWTLAMSNFIDNAGPNAEGARMPQTFIQEPTTTRRAAFLKAWREKTGTERIPVPPAAAQGYDSALLLAAAIEQAGSTDGDRIREALEDLRAPVEGVIMTYDRPFSRTSHETITDTGDISMGEVRNGQVVFAYEDDRRRAARQ